MANKNQNKQKIKQTERQITEGKNKNLKKVILFNGKKKLDTNTVKHNTK